MAPQAAPGESVSPVEQFITFLNDKGIPTLNAFIAGLTGDKGLSAGLAETQRGAEGFGTYDWSSDAVQEIELTIQYDWAFLNF